MKNDFADRKLSAAHSLVKTALASKLYITNLQYHVMMLSDHQPSAPCNDAIGVKNLKSELSRTESQQRRDQTSKGVSAEDISTNITYRPNSQTQGN
jgi:hypothetical protein